MAKLRRPFTQLETLFNAFEYETTYESKHQSIAQRYLVKWPYVLLSFIITIRLFPG